MPLFLNIFLNVKSSQLTSALRPYRLVVEPPPVLTKLLNVNDLVNVYNEVLMVEMKKQVDSVLIYWKSDKQKAAAEEANCKFDHPIPWYPVNSPQSPEFTTNIPEDVASRIVEYEKNSIIRYFYSVYIFSPLFFLLFLLMSKLVYLPCVILITNQKTR